MRTQLFVKVLVMAAAGILGCGCATTAPQPIQDPMKAVVVMGFHSFEPKSVTIDVGGTVRWENKSWTWHTVTADPGLAKRGADVLLPRGADPFDSGRVDKGGSYQETFRVPGTYRYFCQPHEMSGMVGEIIVNPAVPGKKP